MDDQITAFDGHLIRRGKDDYAWSDGSDAPGVVDESLNSHNFRCEGGFVLVPERAARHPGNPELAFCLDAKYQRPVYRRGMILVPIADWDAQAQTPIGISWPQEIEHLVLDKAQDLGWR